MKIHPPIHTFYCRSWWKFAELFGRKSHVCVKKTITLYRAFKNNVEQMAAEEEPAKMLHFSPFMLSRPSLQSLRSARSHTARARSARAAHQGNARCARLPSPGLLFSSLRVCASPANDLPVARASFASG
jgi:hypothetical protein